MKVRGRYTYGELAAARPTGRTRVRIGFRQRLILQLEILHPEASYPMAPPPKGQPSDPWRVGSFTFWRDAELADLQSLMPPTPRGKSEADVLVPLLAEAANRKSKGSEE